MISLSFNLDDKVSENSLTEKLSEINQKEITLEIKSDSNSKVKKMMLNVRLFSKIKKIQDLPDWVIVKLLMAKAKLSDSDFRDRILND